MPALANPTSRECLIDISEDDDLSQVCDLGGEIFCGIVFPAEMDAAVVTYQMYEGGTWYDLYNENGTEMTTSVTEGAYVPVYPETFLGVRYLKIRPGTGGTPTTETADRSLKVRTRAKE